MISNRFDYYYNFIYCFLAGDSEEPEHEVEEADPNAGRFVRYQFTPQFLKLKTVGAT
jgi:hypothetical protein